MPGVLLVNALVGAGSGPAPGAGAAGGRGAPCSGAGSWPGTAHASMCVGKLASSVALQERGADDLPSARAAGSEVSLHRVSLADEPDQVFLLSRWGRLFWWAAGATAVQRRNLRAFGHPQVASCLH